MAPVVDASVAASWALDDERDSIAEQALERVRREGAVVPALFFFEIRNTLIQSERRARISPLDTAAFLGLLGQLPVQVDGAHDEKRLLDLARKHKLTVYDAAYLELALRKGLELATLDAKLEAAWRREGGA